MHRVGTQAYRRVGTGGVGRERRTEMYRLRLRMSRRVLAIAGLAALALSAGRVYAQVGRGFDLSWNTIDGGGGTSSTGGQYSLGGTVGQPDAGSMSGGSYQLDGGFWAAGDSTATPTVTPTSSATSTPSRTNTPSVTSTRTTTPTN